MGARVPFRLRPLAWLVSAALAGTGTAVAAPAARVEFTIGSVTVTGADGRSRPAAKGLTLESGDRIVTASGRAQLRFTDGAYVSLQPNTDFGIREYQYAGKTDGSERGIFSLVRGALRTVTGAIGRVNRGAYRIQTPTATIGIRGTGGLIQILPDGSTLVTGNSGVWSLANQKASVDVPAGKAAKAGPDQTIPPFEVAEGPVLPPPEAPLDTPKWPTKADELTASPTGAPNSQPPFVAGQGTVFVAGDRTNQGGLPYSLFPPIDCASGCDLTVVELFTGASFPSPTNFSAVTLAPGQWLASFRDGAQTKAVVKLADFGTFDGVVGWGRWTTATIDGSPWPGLKALAYVTGVPTPATDITGMSGMFTFNLVGATAPTDGTNTGVVTGGQVIGHFGSFPTVEIKDFTLAIAGRSYSMSQTGISLLPTAPRFSSAVGVTGTGGGACGFTGCSAQVNGQFMGAGATHAGFAYSLSDFGASPTPVVGAAAFKR